MPRPYRSPGRARQVQATRTRVLRAASALFLRRGYLGTTMESVATRAGVSLQTVYNTVGGKAKLLKAVYDVTLAGDEAPVPIGDRPLAQAVLTAPDPRQVLALYARLGRELWERAGPLVTMVFAQAGAGDRDLGAFVAAIERERGVGTTGIAGHLAGRFGLRPGLSREEAADILWTLTGPEVFDRLIVRRGWSLDAAEAWLARTMAESLLGPAASPEPP